jgi:hypothetical protein
MADLIAMLSAAAGVGGAAPTTDPFFNQTTLLLHGDGTNGAQNNTFLDSSSNTFTITRNGNTTQGTFSPFSLPNGKFSNFFAPADFISTPNNAAIQLGSSDFTIEAWIYVTEHGSAVTGISANWSSAGDQRGWLFSVTASAIELRITPVGTSASTVILSHSTTINLNNWYWVSVTRSGTTFSFYVDGTRVGTSTDSTTIFASNQVHQIGNGNGSTTNSRFGGYISNYRLIKGTALYTAATVTVPTAPLTAVANTSVLACQSNRFVDNSSNAFAITVSGTPSVQPFSPFAPSAAYSPSVNGGSGYFDGTGDYLNTGSGNDAITFGSSSYTVEAWIYQTSRSGTQWICGSGGTTFQFAINSTGFVFGSAAGVGDMTAATIAIPLNSWTHVVIVRSSTSAGGVAYYVNGVAAGTATDSTNHSLTGTVNIGTTNNNGGVSPLLGYMASFRVVKGRAVYTSAFTPPTAPVGATSGGQDPPQGTETSLLTNFTNAGIFDNTGKNNLETVGNAQIDTSVKKYGTGSMEFDGSGDYLKTPIDTKQTWNFGTGDFTVEAWVYPTAVGSLDVILGTNSGGVTGGWQIIYDSPNAGVWNFNFQVSGGPYGFSLGSLSLNTWSHIAATRSGTTVRTFVNGTQITSSTTGGGSNIAESTGTLYIGQAYENIGGRDFNGYIDDLRITKGVARYTAAFTPPTEAFPDL